MIHFLRARRGAALTEYGILVGLVAVVAIGAVAQLGATNKGVFENVARELAGVTSGAASTATPEAAPVRRVEVRLSFTAFGYNDDEFGWQSVSPTFGSGISESDSGLDVVAIYRGVSAQNLNLKFAGDTSGMDISGYRLACSSDLNPQGWERPFPPLNYYHRSQSATIYTHSNTDIPEFQSDEQFTCTITSPGT